MAEDKVKKRKINKEDLEKVAARLCEEFDKRKTSNYRLKMEKIWREVDRQIELEAMTRVQRQPGTEAGDWHSVVELGELSSASELYSADIRRITFPKNRDWFDAHSKIDVPLNPDGSPGQVDPRVQKAVDGTLRSLMAQQQIDFGFKARVDLSVKEALHHGSYVVTIETEEQEQFFPDSTSSKKKAPVWKPHSMWNCYPDMSPSVIGENMYYEGSMFIVSYMPWPQFKQIDGNRPGFWAAQLKRVPKSDAKTKDEDSIEDVEIKTYYGDIFIPRSDGDDIFLPNMKCQLYNDVLCFAQESEVPFRPVFYRGWERQDIRSPYYISPVMKMSPMQKLSSVLANRFVDTIELRVDPPTAYDRNDPDNVTGGPDLRPGSRVPTSNPNMMKALELGDPQAALAGLQFCIGHMKESLAVTPQKVGQPLGDRATAREVASVEMGAEVRPVDFISKLEESLRSFLYMQHAMNLRNKTLFYEFYNAEMGLPDFMQVVNKDLPKQAHFEVVGARGILGEKERAQTLMTLAPMIEQIPAFAAETDHREYLRQIYMDAGVKNPESLMKPADGMPPEVKVMMSQMQQQMAQMAQALQAAESGNQVKVFKALKDNHTKMTKILADTQVKMNKIRADVTIAQQDRSADLFKAGAQNRLDAEGQRLDNQIEQLKIEKQADGSVVLNNGKKRVRVQRTGPGVYESTSQTIQ